jgi:excinuclease UvrABC nuclease subunit
MKLKTNLKSKFVFLPKKKINLLPKTIGVYCLESKGEILYIGKALNIQDRMKQHQDLLSLTKNLGYIKTDSEGEALILESKLIKEYQPKHNVVWKDDKNYFYIGLTKEDFPRIFITHQTKDKNTEYIGPFVDGKSLKQALKELRKLAPYRTCKKLPKKKTKPCLWYHLGQCLAPCLLGNVFKAKHLEAYDISNIQGKEATGSMVTFIDGQADKNLYRHFKIRLTSKPNDIAMLKEVLTRRFNHPEWSYPDLIMIDGGKAQLNIAITLAKQYKVKAEITALAKRNNELYIEGVEKPILLKNLPQKTANLLLRLRDEAHRFAISYHHKLRIKSLLAG